MAAAILPSFEDKLDFENNSRGFVASLEPCIIREKSTGRIVWNNDEYRFLERATCPEKAHPSLWRQAQLISKHGLFEVTEGVYQVRGFDLSNMTIIEGKRGIIIADPLISSECAEAALKLYRTHRGQRQVTAIMYTHSHADHFGGVGGVLSEPDTHVPIVAPEGFLEHAVSENVYAGVPMARRADYMYGESIKKGPDAQIGCGIGTTNSTGTTGLIPPTLSITKTGQEEVLDGVRIVFQVTPGAEAPSDMNFYLPQHRALCMADNSIHTLHNILTLRGAMVRDAADWSHYLDEAIVLFGHKSDVVFAGHQWPTWGQESILQYLTEQRDLYGYLHDQTVRLMNQGLTGSEIAEEFVLPDRLQKVWHARGYYGSVSHNVKAIYQRYMGWYDGNPVNLWEHPPVQKAQRYVKCMGGLDATIKIAETFAKEGDLRFAATLLGHAVFADPTNSAAKEALALVFDRLGHGAENSTWRNVYLTGATELRNGVTAKTLDVLNVDMLSALTVDQLLSSLATRLDGPRAQHEMFALELRLEDLKTSYQLVLSNGVLIHRSGVLGGSFRESVGFSCILTKARLIQVLVGKASLDGLEQTGDPRLLQKLLSYMVDPNPSFAIVTP